MRKRKGDTLNHIPTREQIELLRKRYPPGTRVRMQYMDDPQAPPPGAMGTVQYIDDAGQIGVAWDAGSSLSLIPGKDGFSKISAPEKQKKRSDNWER